VFVCFEGIDGAGKSTQARMLCDRLKADGVAVDLVADPGTTKIGTAIRQILLQSDAPISAPAQMLLFAAARAELAAYIKQQLADGWTIICDRWLLSSLVYQGEINNISANLITSIFEETSAVCPDICFLLDIDPAVAETRTGKPRDRYERQSMELRQRMRSAYLHHAAARPHAGVVHIVGAHDQPDVTHAAVYDYFCRVRDGSVVLSSAE
jgi:dTMP kinase